MPIVTKVSELLQPTLVLYVFSGAAMFSCVGWITSDMFMILAEKVTQQLNKSCKFNQTDWSRRLDSWRHQHYTMLQLVDKINNCYGGLLLVLIASSFVMMINRSFLIMRRDLNLNILLHLSILIIEFGHFTMLIYVPHRIRESASFLFSFFFLLFSVFCLHYFYLFFDCVFMQRPFVLPRRSDVSISTIKYSKKRYF